MDNQCWLYQGKCLTEPPEGYYGFVYIITHRLTGKIYVGKKSFTHKKTTRLSKKARKGTRKKVSVKQVDSKWMSYYGSSKELQQDVKTTGKEYFRREVLHFCTTRSEWSYMEVKEQVLRNVLHVDSYNGWISCRIFKRYLSA